MKNIKRARICPSVKKFGLLFLYDQNYAAGLLVITELVVVEVVVLLVVAGELTLEVVLVITELMRLLTWF